MSATISSCLLSAGDMYYVKPYHDLNQNPPIVEDDDDDIMYKVKPISKPANLTESVSLMTMCFLSEPILVSKLSDFNLSLGAVDFYSQLIYIFSIFFQ